MSNFPVSLPPSTPSAGTMAGQTLDNMDGAGLSHSALLARLILDVAALGAKVGIDGTAVGTALEKIIGDHLADTADAHDASAVSVLDSGAHFTGTDVEAVLAELAVPVPPFDTLVPFSSLAGATDSDKLAAFCTAYTAATFKPTLVLDELRDYTFDVPQEIFSGFALIGGSLRAVDQALSAHPYAQKVKIRCTTGTGWLTFPNSTVIGIYVAGLTVDATSSVCNRMFAANASATLQDCTFRDISYQNGPGVIGTPSLAQGMRACTFGGFWNLNNIEDETNGSALHIGGSDNRIVPELMLIDSPNTLMDSTGCLLRFSSLSKTSVEHLYVTADQHMGLDIKGGNSDQMMRISECEFEGRNVSTPSYGCIIRVSMDCTISNSWISFGMSDPTNANGGETINRGIIHVDDGQVLLNTLVYRNATGVADTVPFVYATTGCEYLRVSNCVGSTASTAVRFKPTIKIPSTWVSGTNYDIDNSCTIVTY